MSMVTTSTTLSLLGVLLLTAAVICQSVPECYNVNTQTHKIIDVTGRERYFHGVNVVQKGPPYIPVATGNAKPPTSFTDKDMETLQNLGFNAIRIGIIWHGAEPVKDQFDETYFTLAKSMIEKGAQYGLNFLLDVHQDVMSPKLCGNGFPDWVVDVGNSKAFPLPVDSPPYTKRPNGYPQQCGSHHHQWGDYYLAEATGVAFQNIYNNTNGLLDQFAEYWAKIATEFKTYSNILGYEIINEPWAGDIYRHPTLLVPGQADKHNLAHVYDVVSKAIWDVDPCHNVYFEPVTWDEWTVGFDTVPGGTSNSHRSVLSYHFYVPPDISSVISFYYIVKDLNKLSSAGFLTEFYASSSNTEKVLDEADSHLQSWMAWEMSVLYYDNRTLNTQVVSSLSRSYPQAVAGITNTFSYNKETHKFSLVYTLTKDCTSNVTEIYINEEMHYSKGYHVNIKPVDGIKWYSPSRNRIIVTHNPSLSPGTKIQVDITSV